MIKNRFLYPLKSAIVPKIGAKIDTIKVESEFAYPQKAVEVEASIPASAAEALKYNGSMAVTTIRV